MSQILLQFLDDWESYLRNESPYHWDSEDSTALAALRALITAPKPRVTMDDIDRLWQVILNEPYGDYAETIQENCRGFIIGFFKDHAIGVEVAEGKEG